MSDNSEVTRLRKLLSLKEDENQLLQAEIKERKNRVAGGFYMMSRQAEKNLRYLQRKSPNAALIFSVVRENMQIGTNAVTISNKALQEILSISSASVTRGIKFLRENNYVQVIRTGNMNTYVVNERIAFSGSAGQRKAVFSATVVATESEQEEGWDKIEKLRAVPIIYEDERVIVNTGEELPPPDQLDLDLN